MEETDFTNPQSRIEKLFVKLNGYIAQPAEGGSTATPDWGIDDLIAQLRAKIEAITPASS